MHLQIKQLVDDYRYLYPSENKYYQLVYQQLNQPASITDRKTFPLHITASTLLLNFSHDRVLLLYHAFLKGWLQPGGHLEIAETPLQGAVRELSEESGISVNMQNGSLINIDIHTIAANPKKNDPSHWHCDFCYLFTSQSQQVQLSDESTDFQWFIFDALTDPRLKRIIAKLTHPTY